MSAASCSSSATRGTQVCRPVAQADDIGISLAGGEDVRRGGFDSAADRGLEELAVDRGDDAACVELGGEVGHDGVKCGVDGFLRDGRRGGHAVSRWVPIKRSPLLEGGGNVIDGGVIDLVRHVIDVTSGFAGTRD
jgi:hypothetical protein